jgi:hypothetical protein
MLEPLLQRLEAWRPTAIAVENLSGLQCDFMRRNPARYAESVADLRRSGTGAGRHRPGRAQRQRGDGTPACGLAEGANAAQRRRLAAVFLAAGESSSAVVQWLRLPREERRASDSLTPELVQFLDTRMARRNEAGTDRRRPRRAPRAGAPVGGRRPHGRFAYTGRRRSLRCAPYAVPGQYLRKARRAADERLGQSGQAGWLLALYRDYNAPAAAMPPTTATSARRSSSRPEGFGRNYVGYWETRNLRMVANMRDVLGQHPGTRMLTIVGASHKGYYEAYLNQMHDVQLVSADAVLR